MPAAYRQRGASLLGTIIFLLMAGFFVLCAIRMLPIYFEYLSVRSIVEGIVENYKPGSTGIADIRRSLDTQFNTNQIYALKSRDVEVFRREGETHIDASYEVRVPIVGRIDAVLKFDDLDYVAGEPEE
jgi:hypothetical protein